MTFGFALVREILVKQILFGYLAFFTLYTATLLNYLWPLWDSKNRALQPHLQDASCAPCPWGRVAESVTRATTSSWT